MSMEQIAVMSAVTEQQDQAATAEVALFGARPPDDGLDVVDMCFGFDHRVELGFHDESIRAPEIARCGHRHFDPEPHPWTEATAQASEEREMRGIANRTSRGTKPCHEVQPEHHPQQHESLERERGHVAAFDPTDRLVRHADHATQFALT